MERPAPVSRLAALCALTLLVLPTSAFGWNDTGHRIICEIAYRELGQTARTEVTRLLALDADTATLADACTWADHPPRRPDAHFITVPRTMREIHDPVCHGKTDECLFSAIEADERILADREASDADRLQALKYLGHWIGDIHHPLHVAFADDEFGASIPVDGLACGKNLHEVWDGCLVEEGLGRDAAGIALALRRDLPDVLRRDWLRKPLAFWANESYQIVKTPDIGYCVKRLRSCWSTRETLEHDRDRPRLALDQTYVLNLRLTVAGCMRRAGVRLGGRLNALLGPSAPR